LRPALGRIVGWAVLTASMLTLVISVATGIRAHDFAVCQAQYNEINNQRTRAIVEAADSERRAERRRDDALDATFLDPSLLKPAETRTPEEQRRVRALFTEYLAAAEALKDARAAADTARAANPIPPPPSISCGG